MTECDLQKRNLGCSRANCIWKKVLVSQAENGGRARIDEDDGQGPIWEQEAFELFRDNAHSILTRIGCYFRDDIDDLLEAKQIEKIANGTLIVAGHDADVSL